VPLRLFCHFAPLRSDLAVDGLGLWIANFARKLVGLIRAGAVAGRSCLATRDAHSLLGFSLSESVRASITSTKAIHALTAI
jgi:hypothetical protein